VKVPEAERRDLADIYAYLKALPEPPNAKDIPILNEEVLRARCSRARRRIRYDRDSPSALCKIEKAGAAALPFGTIESTFPIVIAESSLRTGAREALVLRGKTPLELDRAPRGSPGCREL
jgi:hypothetical protein